MGGKGVFSFQIGVKAQVQLAVYLDNIATIVKRTLVTLEKVPSLVQAVTNTLLSADSPVGAGVQQIIDNCKSAY